LQEGEFPIFDFILLGIGRDGHTASLFPGTSAIEEARRAVAAVNFNRRRPDRVTLTLPVLNLGKEVVFLIQGRRRRRLSTRLLRERLFPPGRENSAAIRRVNLPDRRAGGENVASRPAEEKEPFMTKKKSWAVGIDLGGTKIEIVQMDREGTLGQRRRVSTEASRGPGEVKKRLAEAVRTFVARVGSPPAGIGIGVAGLVGPRQGM